jgi:Fur family peroxide stress response transcriptional regulator
MKRNPTTRYDDMVATLRARGCRITPQRLAILRVLAESVGHPTAESVYDRIKDRFPTTSLATVYKTIAALKAVNEVLELGFADGSSRYDGNDPHPHPHLICIRCRAILDPDVPWPEALPLAIAQRAGYSFVGHRFDVYGICPECARAENHGQE